MWSGAASRSRLTGMLLVAAALSSCSGPSGAVVPGSLDPGPCPAPPPSDAAAAGAPGAGEPVRQVIQGRHSGAINAMATSPGGLLATASADGSIRLWDPEQR